MQLGIKGHLAIHRKTHQESHIPTAGMAKSSPPPRSPSPGLWGSRESTVLQPIHKTFPHRILHVTFLFLTCYQYLVCPSCAVVCHQPQLHSLWHNPTKSKTCQRHRRRVTGCRCILDNVRLPPCAQLPVVLMSSVHGPCMQCSKKSHKRTQDTTNLGKARRHFSHS